MEKLREQTINEYSEIRDSLLKEMRFKKKKNHID